MKKTASKHFEDFPSVTLYLSDVQEILEILESECKKVILDTGNYQDVKPSELNELAKEIVNKRFPDIYIKAYDPYISIDLRSYGISVYISEDAIKQRGVVSKIRDVMNSRTRRHFGKLTNALTLLPAMAAGALVVADEYKLAGIMAAISFVAIYPVVKYQMANKVVICTENKSQRASFFERRKDELIIGLVSAAAGALISFLLVKLQGQG